MFGGNKKEAEEKEMVLKVDIESPIDMGIEDIQYIIRKAYLEDKNSYRRVNEFFVCRNILVGRDREFVTRVTGSMSFAGTLEYTTDYMGNKVPLDKKFFMEITQNSNNEYNLHIYHTYRIINCKIEFNVR